MKSHFVADLADGQIVSSPFLVREKEIRTSARTGTSWLQLELADRTGTISAKMWDNYAALAETFERDDIIQIRGRVKLYNGRKELTLEQIVPVAERDYDLGDFLPHTKYDVEKLYADLRAAIAGMKNSWLQQLLASVVEDPAIAPRLKRAPAAMTMHHAYLGGLIEHIASLIGLAGAVTAHYPELDRDLLLAGVVLHDIGKIDELCYARGINYSDEGRLLGHIMIGVALVQDKCKAIPGIPRSAGRTGGASHPEPPRLARVRLAFAAAVSRGGGAAFHRRPRFEDGRHARLARCGICRAGGGPVDGAQPVAAPRPAARGQIPRRRGSRRQREGSGKFRGASRGRSRFESGSAKGMIVLRHSGDAR